MARMYPDKFPVRRDEKVAQSGERLIYEALERDLGDEYIVIYSVAWLGRDPLGEPKDGESDFVIVHKTRGVFILEVKGGRISRDSNTGKWASEDRNKKVWSIKDPAQQARRNKYALRSKLQSLPSWRDKRFRYGHAIAFPHCEEESFDLGPDIPKDIVVYSNHLEKIGQQIDKIVDYWTASESMKGPGMSGDDAERIVTFLAPKIELKRTLGARIREDEMEILRLTEQQADLLQSLNENRRVAISGGAGTGKTMLAIEKAKDLAGEGYRTLLTCFNRPLAEELKNIIGETENLTVDTFHGFCEDMAQRAKVELVSVKTDPAAYFSELPAALEKALEVMPDERFDAIVVDEGQDFHADWLTRLEFSLKNPGTDIFYVFYDGNQRIYGREFALPESMFRFQLTKNLRNTKSIHDFALPFYKGRDYTAKGPYGQSVELICAEYQNDVREELRTVMHRLLKKERVKLSDIAILTGRSLEKSIVRDWDMVGVTRLGKMVVRKHNEVLCESVWRFKGLERPVVILIDFADAMKRNETIFYIAVTRARDHLIIIESSKAIKSIVDEVK